MRISDWNPDVCSSDLLVIRAALLDHSRDLAKRARQRLATIANGFRFLGAAGFRGLEHLGSHREGRELHRGMLVDAVKPLVDPVQALGHGAERERVIGQFVLRGREPFDGGSLQGYFPAQTFKGGGGIVGRRGAGWFLGHGCIATSISPCRARGRDVAGDREITRSEENTSELQSLMRISYAEF